MRNNQIKNIKPLRERRRALRKNLTPAEAYLWAVLKNKQLEGRKFRRQQSIEYYIVDFYCASERMIIELDGEVHNDIGQVEYDFKRDTRLKKLGYKVLRFENRMVFEQFDNVLREIVSSFTPPASPLFLGEMPKGQRGKASPLFLGEMPEGQRGKFTSPAPPKNRRGVGLQVLSCFGE